MPRKPRFNLPDIPQHVIQRGNNREPCFYDDTDYHRYLDDLASAANRFNCDIHAYVLMTNHVHLLVTPRAEHAIAQTMQTLGRRYVGYFNHVHGRSGTRWEGRYKSCLVDSDAYLLSCMRHIELNPVRAGMVSHPDEYRWSSYAANAQGRADSLLTAHPLYLALAPDAAGRLPAYRELFRQQVDGATLHDIRNALNHERVLGRSRFKDRIEALTGRQARLGKPGRPFAQDSSADDRAG